ncbi:MFS transporter [Schlesneria paludicola]|uniref:MFS transporter n=1 Tax=Schlesneria paludicola TaxID=360056 RepID=UPI000299E395|nr:MFS transporter [Schlesneria paludicola]
MNASTATTVGLKRTVPLLMLVVACGHFNRISISVIGNEQLIPKYGISPDRMGLVYSAFLLFYTVAMLPGGWLIDRFGPRAALTLLGFGSVVFVGLSGCTAYLSKDVEAIWISLLIVRSFMGVFNAPLHPAAARMVSQCVEPRSRVLANGFVTFSACVGMAATYSVMGYLIDHCGWTWALGVSSVMTLIVTLAWTSGTQRSPKEPQSSPPNAQIHDGQLSLWHVLRQPSVICITLSYAAMGYFQYLFFYWINFFFETVQQQDRSVARWYATIITLSMGLGMVGGGWLVGQIPARLSPRWRRSLVPVLGMISSGLIFEVGLLASNPHVTLVLLAISAALIGACEGSFWTTSVELGGRYGGTTASLMNTGCNIGGTLSPSLTPVMSQIFAQYYGQDLGWRISLAVAGGIVVAGAFLWWGINPSAQEDDQASVESRFQGPLDERSIRDVLTPQRGG